MSLICPPPFAFAILFINPAISPPTLLLRIFVRPHSSSGPDSAPPFPFGSLCLCTLWRIGLRRSPLLPLPRIHPVPSPPRSVLLCRTPPALGRRGFRPGGRPVRSRPGILRRELLEVEHHPADRLRDRERRPEHREPRLPRRAGPLAAPEVGGHRDLRAGFQLDLLLPVPVLPDDVPDAVGADEEGDLAPGPLVAQQQRYQAEPDDDAGRGALERARPVRRAGHGIRDLDSAAPARRFHLLDDRAPGAEQPARLVGVDQGLYLEAEVEVHARQRGLDVDLLQRFRGHDVLWSRHGRSSRHHHRRPRHPHRRESAERRRRKAVRATAPHQRPRGHHRVRVMRVMRVRAGVEARHPAGGHGGGHHHHPAPQIAAGPHRRRPPS
mmetsp:Transcript_3833/g.9078  ORF Transcript_3833/g.9078 Transcript_3833/m.9078 type:complete len:381 (-) Transcript_3833:720-1862(-)